MNIKKLSAVNSPIVNIIFSNQTEYKECLNAVKKSSGMIAKAGNFSISADSLMAAYNTLKKTVSKNKMTGEISVQLSGSQITDILPLFFCMSLYMVEERDQKVTKTIAQTKSLKGDMACLCGKGYIMSEIRKKPKEPPKTIESELKKLLDTLDQIQKITAKWR